MVYTRSTVRLPVVRQSLKRRVRGWRSLPFKRRNSSEDGKRIAFGNVSSAAFGKATRSLGATLEPNSSEDSRRDLSWNQFCARYVKMGYVAPQEGLSV